MARLLRRAYAMIRFRELPDAIHTAINNWRLWVTLSITALFVIYETVVGLREGEDIKTAVTRLSISEVIYLLLVSGIVAQAAIGAVPFTTGVLMTLYDQVLARRRGWKEEGREEGIKQGIKQGSEAMLRTYIAAVLADETLTAEQKNKVIAILNSATPE